MPELAKFIKSRMRPMNKKVMEGITYHELKDAMSYVDNKIRYIELDRTNTHLKYLGCRIMTPKETTAFRFNNNSTRPFNLAESNIYYVEYSFSYNNEEEVRKCIMALPWVCIGNEFKIFDKMWNIMPTITDKVISVGDSQIFVDVSVAKWTIRRNTHTIIEDNKVRNLSIVLAEIYTKQSNRLAPTTNAKPIMMHYILANYGFTKAMELLLGFVPEVTLSDKNTDGKVVIKSRNAPPDNYIHTKKYKKSELENDVVTGYTPNPIKFLITPEQDCPEVVYILGNVLYILDHFPNEINISQLDDTVIWKRYIGEIILSGKYSIAYLLDKMEVHFDGFTQPLEREDIDKLRDLGVECNNVFELMVVVMKNFNTWVMNSDSRSFYHHKTIEAARHVLIKITSCFNKLYFDINKDELTNGGLPIDIDRVDKAFKNHIKTNNITSIRYEKMFVQIVEDSTPHRYFKGTAFINKQEGNSINKTKGKGGPRNKLSAPMCTVGSLFYLSKSDIDPFKKVNPWVTTDPNDNTILPDPEFGHIVEETGRRLAITHTTGRSVDVNDGEALDVDNDFDIENDDFEDDDSHGDFDS